MIITINCCHDYYVNLLVCCHILTNFNPFTDKPSAVLLLRASITGRARGATISPKENLSLSSL